MTWILLMLAIAANGLACFSLGLAVGRVLYGPTDDIAHPRTNAQGKGD